MQKTRSPRGSAAWTKRLRELAELTAQVAKGRTDVKFENPYLVKCWERKNCGQASCPSYQSENLRCWQVAGTFCRGEVQGFFAKKLGDCTKCEVFQESCLRDPITATGENFNNMLLLFEDMFALLQNRSREVMALNRLITRMLDDKLGSDEAYKHLRDRIRDVLTE